MKKITTKISRYSLLVLITIITGFKLNAQDTTVYKLRLSLPVLDVPQNIKQISNYPSMNQALEVTNDMYDISYYGIDALGDMLIKRANKSGNQTFLNSAFKYAAGLGFSKYASELPLPFGVWMHEEYHRSVLGVNHIKSKNGNWIFNRWDGTVYGVSDSALAQLKSADVNQLAYAYTAGVQSEIALSKKISFDGFYHKRSIDKSSLLLYNAWHVFKYFSDAAGNVSDSEKVIIPRHESSDPLLNDFAGNDLTAWVYDMFNPDSSYYSRPTLPNSSAVNRHIGYNDLSPEAQDYLKHQKHLSLLNFINPSIFFIERIKVAKGISFNFLVQYAPTYFGRDVAVYLPVQLYNYNLVLATHNYKSFNSRGHGYEIGISEYRLTDKINADVTLRFWQQPQAFYTYQLKTGFGIDAKATYNMSKKVSVFAGVQQKTKGWVLNSPYTNHNLSAQIGFSYSARKS